MDRQCGDLAIYDKHEARRSSALEISKIGLELMASRAWTE